MAADRARTAELRVGCSGWDYKEWRGAVYPSELTKKEWFDHYQSMFDTVEINATFYRLPDASTVDHWRERARPGFRYAVKLGQYGTHRKKLKDADQWVPNFLDRAERLRSWLGPVIAQLPPRWNRDVDRLRDFLAVLPRRHRWAIELRDPSWIHDDVFQALADHAAALCLHDLLADHPPVLTTDWTYVRFHGPDALEKPYHGTYSPQALAAHADRMAGWLDEGYDVYAFFNNDAEADAPRDARRLREMLDRRRSG